MPEVPRAAHLDSDRDAIALRTVCVLRRIDDHRRNQESDRLQEHRPVCQQNHPGPQNRHRGKELQRALTMKSCGCDRREEIV